MWHPTHDERPTAQKDESPGAASAEAFKGYTEPNTRDSARDAPKAQLCDPTDKHFATLQASLALRGFTLTCTDSASGPVVYTVVRWGLTRDLATLEDLAAFADRVGAPS